MYSFIPQQPTPFAGYNFELEQYRKNKTRRVRKLFSFAAIKHSKTFARSAALEIDRLSTSADFHSPAGSQAGPC
jgi:hypothetical protein